MNETQAKYLAGLLDADGSLSFTFKETDNKNGFYYVGLRMGLSASDGIDKLGFVADLPNSTGFGSVSRSSKNEHIVTWVVSKRADLEMLLPRVIKHMVIKGKHWNWLLKRWREIRVGGAPVPLPTRESLTEASKASRVERVGPLKAKNYPTWAWLAGYIDGDGWYTHRRNWNKRDQSWQWGMRVGIVAHENDACGLELIQNAFGGAITPHTQSPTLKVWQHSLGYQNKAFALRFLPHLAKHSKLKRDKIDAIIHHHRQRLSVPGTDKTFCTVDACNDPTHGNGLCRKHYLREYRRQKV